MNKDTKLEIDVAKMQENIKTICNSVESIRMDIAELRVDIRSNYATKEELAPLKRFVQGAQGAGFVVLMGILALLISHVVPGFRL